MRIVSTLRMWREITVNTARLRTAAATVGLAVLLAGCGSTIGSMPIIGEPPQTPPAPAGEVKFPAVGVTPGRPVKAMTAEERAKVEAELTTARARAADERRQKINQPGE
jgi:hypothetical protein